MKFNIVIELDAKTTRLVKAAAKKSLGRPVTDAELTAFMQSDVVQIYAASLYEGYTSIEESAECYFAE